MMCFRSTYWSINKNSTKQHYDVGVHELPDSEPFLHDQCLVLYARLDDHLLMNVRAYVPNAVTGLGEISIGNDTPNTKQVKEMKEELVMV